MTPDRTARTPSRAAVTPDTEAATPDRTVRPPAGVARPLDLPTFEGGRLANGLRYEFARRPGIPEVSLRLIMECGAGAEPAAHAGVAALAARLLVSGTPGRDAMDVARRLDRLGAVHAASAGYSVGAVAMECLSEVFDEALDFLAETTLRSDFPESEVVRLRDERLDEIKRRRDEPAAVADLALIGELYGEGLYGRPVAGTEETVSQLARETVCAFHEARYRPGGALLVICGDVSSERIGPAVEARFEGWTGRCGRVEPPPTPEAPGGGVILIDRPGSPQSEVRVGTVGVPFGTDDHYAIIVANAILGGLFHSRINLNLREDKGWTYGARSDFRFRRGAGPFVARTAVETAVTGPAFEEILKEIDMLSRELVSKDELQLVRNALTLSLPRQFETAPHVCAKRSRQRIFGLPEDYWEEYTARIVSVTPEQIRATCRKYLGPDRLTLLAVGDAEKAAPALGELGAVDIRPLGEV